MNPTTPSEFNFVIQSTIETTFKTICLLHDLEVGFEWETTIASEKGQGAMVTIDFNLDRTQLGRHILDRFRNALNAFGYDLDYHGDVHGPKSICLFIRLSEEIRKEASDGFYADLQTREEEQLQKSGRLY